MALLERDFYWPSQVFLQTGQKGLDTGQFEANQRKLINGVNAAQGGADAGRVRRGFFDRDLSLGAGTQTIAGVGFNPSVISFVSAPATGAGAGMSIGYVDGWSQTCALYYGAYTPGSFTSAFHPVYLQTASDACMTASVSSTNADGFVLAWSVATGSPVGTYRINWQCWR